MSRDWKVYAQHIVRAIAKIRRIEKRGDLRDDDVLYDAVLRNLQTLSEATQRLPDDLKAQYDNIPWRQIAAFRNVLVHNYLGEIDPQTVYFVVTRDLPALETAARAMLKGKSEAE